MKVCCICKESKSLDEFYKNKSQKDGLCGSCKICDKQSTKKWVKTNPERHIENTKKWIKNNPERHKEKQNKWRINNYEQYRENIDKWRTNNYKSWRENESKYRSILENRLKHSIRANYNKVIPKEYRQDIIKVLGCSIKDFIIYLEKQFDENMNWDNYGKYWEVDHIHPKSLGGIYHYSNTQPLSIKENRIKSNKICNTQKPIVY